MNVCMYVSAHGGNVTGSYWYQCQGVHMDGWVKDFGNSSAFTMELQQPYAKPSLCVFLHWTPRISFHYSDVIMSTMASQITSISNCLLSHLFRRRSKKTSKPHVTGLCEGNSPETGEFPAQRASSAEKASIWCTNISDWWINLKKSQ